MVQVVIRGESVYECDTCDRRIRIPTNKYGLDVMQRCMITSNCQGTLHRVTATKDINATPAFPPEVDGVQDWFQRKVFYEHNQTIKTQAWTVNHNLQNIPVFHVFVNRLVDGVEHLVEHEPTSVTTIDANTTLITFNSAESGVVHCVSSSSQNTTNFDVFATLTDDAATMQVTSDVGEITIATLDTSELVDLTVTYTASPNITTSFIGVDDVTSINSPWVGARHAIINGRRYTLRSFSVVTTPQVSSYIAAGMIPDGSAFYISAVNGVAVKPNDVLFLLSRAPHSNVDRVYDKCIDAAQINQTSPEMFYAGGKAFVSTSVTKSTYPLILVV